MTKDNLRSELVEWRFVPRARREGYMTRDFFVSGKRYRHFASSANDKGVIRHGHLVGEE